MASPSPRLGVRNPHPKLQLLLCQERVKLRIANLADTFGCNGRLYFIVFRSLLTNSKVKELLKSVHICQSYRKNKSGTFFMAHGVNTPCLEKEATVFSA